MSWPFRTEVSGRNFVRHNIGGHEAIDGVVVRVVAVRILQMLQGHALPEHRFLHLWSWQCWQCIFTTSSEFHGWLRSRHVTIWTLMAISAISAPNAVTSGSYWRTIVINVTQGGGRGGHVRSSHSHHGGRWSGRSHSKGHVASITSPLGHFGHLHHFGHESVTKSGFFLVGSVHVFVGVHDFFF